MKCRTIKNLMVIYFLCIVLWGIGIFFDLSVIIKEPVFKNGIMLEVGIIGFVMCCYLFFTNKKQLEKLKEKEMTIRIVKKVRNSYI